MAFDAFLKIDDVKGESTDDKHKDEIEILHFSLGVSNPVTIGSATTGAGGGKASFSPFSVSKRTDKASPTLFLHCTEGKHFKEAKVTLRKAGGGGQEYLVYTFKQVYVDSISWSGSEGGDDVPMEAVTFAYGEFHIDYKPQKSDGSLDSPVKAAWSLAQNKKL